MKEQPDIETHFKTRKFGIRVFKQSFLTAKGVKQFTRGWYFSRMVNGKSTRFPLGYDRKNAEKLAEEIAGFLSIPTNTIDMAETRYNPRKGDRHTTCATFSDILESYEGALAIIGRKGNPVSESSFRGYKSSLATMLRRVEAYRNGTDFISFTGRSNIDFSKWFNQPIDILTTRFAMDFKMASIPKDDGDVDEDEMLSAKISANTVLRCARALFSKQAMRYYREIELKLPDISGFMSEPEFTAKKYFQMLPMDVVVNVMRESIALRISDIDAYRAFLLTMHCGLRRAEALAYKPTWLRDGDRDVIEVAVDGRFKPKHGKGRKVFIEHWVADLLRELGPVQQSASMSRLNAWATRLIPDEDKVNKPIHELRKLWISCKAKTEGIHSASSQAGHTDVRTTTTFYADNSMPDRLLPLWKEETGAAILKFNAA